MIKTDSLSEAFNYQHNSLTFLRFILVMLVIFSHSFILGGFGQDPLKIFSREQASFGSIALNCFFIISGFLTPYSYLSASSVWRYLWHRILRIFPAFWFCLLVAAFIIGPIVYSNEDNRLNEVKPGYFQTKLNNPLNYIKANLFLKIGQRGIANLFEKNPYPQDINGSLWMLPYLFGCYLFIAGLGVLNIFNKYRLVVLGFFLILTGVNAFERSIAETVSIVIPRLSGLRVPDLFVYFLAGSIFYIYRDKIMVNLFLFLLSLLISIIGLWLGLFKIFSPLTLTYIVFWLSIKLPLSNFGKWGDYSYSLYLYAFPIQQSLVVFGTNRYGFPAFFFLSMVFTIPLALLSWHFIEKPCSQLKSIASHSVIK